MSTTYAPPYTKVANTRAFDRQRAEPPLPDSSAQLATLQDAIARMGFTVEIFHVASGWFAAIFQPGQNCALGVAVDQPTEATALAIAIDDAMKATRFDFRTPPQPQIEPVKRRRTFER